MLGADVKLINRRDSLMPSTYNTPSEDVVHSTYRRFQYELYWLSHFL